MVWSRNLSQQGLVLNEFGYELKYARLRGDNMELLYIWINKSDNEFINNQGVNFYGGHKFSLITEENPKRYILSYAPVQNGINLFNNGCVKNITAIVGENGAGKTTLFRYLYTGGCLPR